MTDGLRNRTMPGRGARRLAFGVATAIVAASLGPVSAASADTGPGYLQLATRNAHSCAIVADGRAACWGDNGFGQLGNGSQISASAPIPVTTDGTVLAGKTITQVATGFWHSCAVTADGEAACWGNNSYGQFGNGNTQSSNLPTLVTKTGPLVGKSFVQIGAGSYHSCALTSDGIVACWGDNAYAQSGSGTGSLVPVPIERSNTPMQAKTAVQIGVGEVSSCALTTDGAVYCWGTNNFGQLGNNTFNASPLPDEVVTAGTPLAGQAVTKISVGDRHVCALANDAAACWGSNGSGELGNDDSADSPVPVGLVIAGTPLAGKSIGTIAAGVFRTCAVATDGTPACWGSGYLGTSTMGSSRVPVAVTTAGTPLDGRTVIDFSTGGAGHACALTSDGTAACWGDGGRLGDGTDNSSAIAVEVLRLDPIFTTPGAPSIGTATAGDAQATVNWTAPASDGGSSITGYVVTPFIGATAQSPITFDSTATSQAVAGLTAGTSYTFKVAAKNAAGTGPLSAASNAVTPTLPAGVPGAPAIGAADPGTGQVALSWTAPASSGDTPITAYVVTPFVGSTAQTPVTFDSTAVQQTITGLTNGTTYTFRVAAKNSIGTGPRSAESNAATPAFLPSAPSIGTASAGNASATVRWTATTGSTSPVTAYVVTPYIGTTAETSVTFNSTALTQVMTGLSNASTYTFKVAAKNAIGVGPNSAASNAVRPDGTAPTVSMVLPTRWNLSTNVSVKWSGSDAGLGGVKNYDVGRRAGAWNGQIATASTTWLSGTTLTTKTFAGTYGSTYCMKVRGRDYVGNVSAYSAERCGAIPLRADQMTYDSHWWRNSSVSAFAGFDMRTDIAGATVTRPNIIARRISLIATRGPNCGSIKVYWNGVLQKTVSLVASASVHRQIVDLLTFPTATSGTLKLVATTSVKTVIIEGLGISKTTA